MVNNHKQSSSLCMNIHNHVCNVQMNKIKRPRPLDTHQERNAFSTDGIKVRRCSVDRLQTLRTNVHQTMDNSDRLLKLNPYPILDTDPTLDCLNFSSSRSPHSIENKIKDNTTQSTFEVKSNDRHHEVFENYDKSRQQWEKNEKSIDREEFNNIDFNHTSSKKYDMHVQPSILRQRKIQTTVPPKSLVPTNLSQKTGGSSSITNGHLTNQNLIIKDLVDISKPEIHINHIRAPIVMPTEKETNLKKHIRDVPKVKELLINTKKALEDKEMNKNGHNMSPKELIHIRNDTSEKEQIKLSDKNNKNLNIRTRRKTDITNNTSVFAINSMNNHLLNSSMELTLENTTQKTSKSPIIPTFNKNVERDFMTDEPNKLAFDNLFKDSQKRIDSSKRHSALRLSLFSNMPPYIRFSSHDVKGESFPLPLQKLLKWKLSSITPIVVRRTIQNSGFKLVRSEPSLVHDANNPPIITNQSDQPTISLQHYCGITPPIVDAYCGTIPPPNELMMLPRSQSNDWVGTWGKHMKSSGFQTLCEQQKLNHLPGTFQIGRKDRLWKNLHRLILKYGKDQFGFIPTSYILPQEAKVLRQIWEKNDEDKWIVKPPASARGTGIRVISKWNQIPKKVPLVVQRYIDNPYLINDTKFDLRLYILITSINPLRLYLYDNGLVRFASVKYSSDLTTISDRYMHLTNYSINRLSSQYTQNEDADACHGHKWTLRSLWTYMKKERHIDVKKLWDSLADLVIKTVISGESPMSQMCRSNLSNRYNAYELFGIDVLFDEFLKPWILEVNISPSLHSSSPLDLAVKGPLIKDLMNMVGYHIPNNMSPSTNNTLLKMLGVDSPLCFDKRLYTYSLSAKEREKQEYFTNVKSREEYIENILDNLMPDDVRHLIAYEDELTQTGSFQKVFPTASSFKYHEYFDGPRYYNMLFDAWECKYSNKRSDGIAVLEKLCQLNVHLEVPDVDEEQPKSCDSLQPTQMEVEKSVADKINDNQA